MSDPTPTPTPDAFTEAFKADSLLDDARARELLENLTESQRNVLAVTQLAAQFAAQRNDKLVAAYQTGQGLSDREAAVYILAGLPASTKASTAKTVVSERLQILRDLRLG